MYVYVTYLDKCNAKVIIIFIKQRFIYLSSEVVGITTVYAAENSIIKKKKMMTTERKLLFQKFN